MTKLPIPSEVLNALEAHVYRTSLRRTARELGLSPTGLSMVLAGRPAQARTLRKALAWYAENAGREGAAVPTHTIGAMLALLVRHLPEAYREETVRAILALVRQASETARVRAPGWTAASEG